MKTLITALLIAGSLQISAQTPVQWAWRVEKKGEGLFQLSIEATIDKGWHIYAQEQPKNGRAVPTSFTFIKSPLLSYKGKVKEEGRLFHYNDRTVDISQNQYSGHVVFTQLVGVKANVKTELSGNIQFQACNEYQCLPPRDQAFSVTLSNESNQTK